MSPGKTRSSKATVNTDEITDFLHSIKDESAEAVLQAILSGNMDAKFSATSDNMSALHYACKVGNYRIVKFLLSQRAAVDDYDKYGNTPLHYAVEFNYADIVKELLNAGATVNIANKERLLTPLHTALAHNHVAIAELLIENYANVNSPDVDGNTPFHYAAYSGSLPLVHLLLIKISSIKVRNKQGENALHIAAARGHLPVVQTLTGYIDSGLKTHRHCIPLHYALRNNHLDVVQYFISQKSIAEYTGPNMDISLLNAAIESGNITILDFILAQPDVTIPKDKHWKGLHIAYIEGHKDVMKLLITRGANINAIHSETGKTLLHEVITAGDVATTHYILSLPDVDITILDKQGKSILHCAVEANAIPILTELQQHPDIHLIVNAVCKKTLFTALHIAVIKQYTHCVEQLMQFPSLDRTIRDKTNRSALDIAKQNSMLDIVVLLEPPSHSKSTVAASSASTTSNTKAGVTFADASSSSTASASFVPNTISSNDESPGDTTKNKKRSYSSSFLVTPEKCSSDISGGMMMEEVDYFPSSAPPPPYQEFSSTDTSSIICTTPLKPSSDGGLIDKLQHTISQYVSDYEATLMKKVQQLDTTNTQLYRECCMLKGLFDQLPSVPTLLECEALKLTLQFALTSTNELIIHLLKQEKQVSMTTNVPTATTAAAATGDMKNVCIQCHAKEASILFLPCKHQLICVDCMEKLLITFTHCPVCQKLIHQQVAIHDT